MVRNNPVNLFDVLGMGTMFYTVSEDGQGGFSLLVQNCGDNGCDNFDGGTFTSADAANSKGQWYASQSTFDPSGWAGDAAGGFQFAATVTPRQAVDLLNHGIANGTIDVSGTAGSTYAEATGSGGGVLIGNLVTKGTFDDPSSKVATATSNAGSSSSGYTADDIAAASALYAQLRALNPSSGTSAWSSVVNAFGQYSGALNTGAMLGNAVPYLAVTPIAGVVAAPAVIGVTGTMYTAGKIAVITVGGDVVYLASTPGGQRLINNAADFIDATWGAQGSMPSGSWASIAGSLWGLDPDGLPILDRPPGP